MIKRFLIALLLLLPAPAFAQQAWCPAYSMGAVLHASGESAYTLSPNDQCHMLVFQTAAGETITLPVPGAHFPFGWVVHLFAHSASGNTLSPATGTTVNGTTTLSVSTGTGVWCHTTGTAWWCGP